MQWSRGRLKGLVQNRDLGGQVICISIIIPGWITKCLIGLTNRCFNRDNPLIYCCTSITMQAHRTTLNICQLFLEVAQAVQLSNNCITVSISVQLSNTAQCVTIIMTLASLWTMTMLNLAEISNNNSSNKPSTIMTLTRLKKVYQLTTRSCKLTLSTETTITITILITWCQRWVITTMTMRTIWLWRSI